MALEPARHRRHREGGVLGEHRDDRVDVVALPGVGVLLDELAQLLVAERAQGLLLALLGKPLLDRRAGALQRAVHRGDAGVERVRGLLCREAQHLAQDQHRALVRRQQLQGGDEGELHGLALLVAGVRGGVAVLDAEGLVREGLDPDRLHQRLADAAVRVGRRARSRSAGSAWAAGRSHRARCWSRSGRARSAASCGPRTCRGPSRRGPAPPGARPRRPAPSRACGSSGPGARSGAARPAGA